MDEFVNTYLCRLLQRVISQDVSLEPSQLTMEEFDNLLKLARRHEVQPIAAYGLLLSGGITQAQEQYCRKLVYQMVLYQERMDQELSKTCDLLEKAQIAYMPLKGAVMRGLYPEPWLRTSGDIDILVKDADRAAEILVEHGYRYREKGSHDITVISPLGILIELHFQLIETDPQVNALLERVWDYARPRQGSFRYDMEPELFYFYHIAHMAKHMLNGGCGCGIRFFVDIHLLLEKVSMDKEKKAHLLQAGGLATFARQAECLGQRWFGKGQPELSVSALEQYVLDGGVFGSQSNMVRLARTKADNSVTFLFLRLFWPYKRMALRYPVLKKYPILLPVFWIWRWIEVLLGHGRIQKAVRELTINKDLDTDSISATKRLFQELELISSKSSNFL